MAHALLLSPDDQAVSAITGVLEEMSVTCERPLDGVSAAQKLNSQSFDLVLVDCENLPAAKLIFDVCRRAKAGNNPVPIAIVDGRAGLPTAFRLGAELILTKPVAKDQARTTIRTAVSRVRKETPAAEHIATSVGQLHSGESNDDNPDSLMGAAMTGTGIPLDFATESPSSNSAPQLTAYAEAGPSIVSAASPTATSATTGAASAAAAAISRSTIEYIKEAKAEDKPLERPKAPSPSLNSSAEVSANTVRAVMKPSDDPVLAELELTEMEAEQKKIEISKSAKLSAEKLSSETSKNTRGNRVLSPEVHEPGQRRRNGMLVGTLMLALAGGGFYAVWNYQPGFKAMANGEINRALRTLGVSVPSGLKSAGSAKAAPAVVPNSIDRPASESKSVASPANLTAAAPPVISTSTDGEARVASPAPAAAIADGASQSASAATQSGTATSSAAASADLDKASVTKSEISKPAEIKKESDSGSARDHADNSLVLSSQGAQKRLVYSVQPQYSAEERAHGTRGSIVLKTFVKNDGNVADVRLVEGSPAYASAAIEAVKQWRYRPLQREGKALPFQTVVIVDAPKQ